MGRFKWGRKGYELRESFQSNKSTIDLTFHAELMVNEKNIICMYIIYIIYDESLIQCHLKGRIYHTMSNESKSLSLFQNGSSLYSFLIRARIFRVKSTS